MIYLLPIAFLGIAFLYSMAGFGGGSSYIAFMVIGGLPVASIPVLALSCNLIVSGQGSLILARSGKVNMKLLLPLLLGSVPAAFIGGAWRLQSDTFLIILTSGLTLAGVALLLPARIKDEPIPGRHNPALLLPVGVLLGGLAGVSGIGGGIFLAPVLHLLRLDTAKSVAAAAAVFIALNSCAGLAGQLSKGTGNLTGLPLWIYIACPVAVTVGGFFGSRNLSRHLSGNAVRNVTALIVLLVAVRLWLKVLDLV
jgi:uncharacterized membrane protein YfcA